MDFFAAKDNFGFPPASDVQDLEPIPRPQNFQPHSPNPIKTTVQTHLHHDFLKFGWSAQVQDGNFKGQSLLNIFNRNGVVQASKWHRDLDASALLDSRKRPINSKSYESTK